MSIGKNIAVYRKNKGLTQGELGELLGVTNQAVSKWEGEISMPDVMLLPEIAKVLDVTVDELYTLKESKPAALEGDDRIVVVDVEDKGAKVKCAVPLEVLKGVTGMFGNKGDSIGEIFKNLGDDFTGTIVDIADSNSNSKVVVSVEHYENKNL
ncbi:MAG: helix-turn-helix transcriptional regulator [Clostridia bacterium]|nr:helix-turn-helix transcriptional regulator [Clostridia bacterium]